MHTREDSCMMQCNQNKTRIFIMIFVLTHNHRLTFNESHHIHCVNHTVDVVEEQKGYGGIQK